MTTVTVVGDSIVDVDVTGEPDRVGPEGCVVLDATSECRRPGGAALAASFAASDGADVRLVTALSDDEPGRWLHEALLARGITVHDIGLDGPTPEKWRLRTPDGTLLRVDHGCREIARLVDPEVAAGALAEPGDGVLVADYGRGVAEVAAASVATVARSRPVAWDPHPRGPAPPPGLDLLVPNEREAAHLARGSEHEPTELARVLAARFSTAVAVTCGGRGAVLACPDGAVIDVPATPFAGDTCGAGDRLASRVALHRAMGRGLLPSLVDGVAAAARFVSHGSRRENLAAIGAGERIAKDRRRDAPALATAVRATGGTVVAAGGCFDLLHAGHVQLLESARALGDCLIVCMNSDQSVRRLKGPGRPIVDERDRRRLLEALACVDAVLVFDEATPVEALERLRPHVFAKGADYAIDQLPERAVLESWGGRIAILPLAARRSTTRLIDTVRSAARSAS